MFLELINLSIRAAPSVSCQWRRRFLCRSQSSVMKREHAREAASTAASLSSVRLPSQGQSSFNSDILQCGQGASLAQGNEFTAALKSLYDRVHGSMHDAQVSQAFSLLPKHCRMAAPTFPMKHPSKDNWATCQPGEMLQKISTKNFQQTTPSLLPL